MVGRTEALILSEQQPEVLQLQYAHLGACFEMHVSFWLGQ